MLKKTLYLAILGVMAFASCSKQMEEGEIYFGKKSITVTKAVTESTNNGIKANGFKAAVVIDANNTVMFNKTLTLNNGVYTVPGETYYYPSIGTISAYAAYPASENITLDAGVATLAYSQNATEDLIAAKANGISKQGAPINLTFGHVLSQVSFLAKGKDVNANYKLKLIEVTAPAGGTYRYASNDWANLGTTTAYNAYTNTGAAVPTNAYQAYGESMTFVPGDVALRVVWDCYNKVDGTLIASYDQSIDATLVQGNRSTFKLLLPNGDADEIKFQINVGAWNDDEQEYEVKPAVYVFTVNESGKKVQFSPGNLYWDGSKFAFEAHQYDYPTTRNADHIGHFFYSKDAAIARAASLDDPSATDTDVLFAANGGAVEGYTVLKSDEWQYLIDHNMQSKNAVTIAGINCSVFVPDGYARSVASSYTAETWKAAEAEGLVAIPYAGYFYNGSVRNVGSYGYCWSCSPCAGLSDYAWGAYFNLGGARTSEDDIGRRRGFSVRLVKEVKPALEMVDLGLPSGLKRAKCNIGAEKETDYGMHFKFGDVVGHDAQYGDHDDSIPPVEVDGNNHLLPAYDAATQLMGTAYRMPTKEEINELISNTDHAVMTIDGVSGMRYSKRGDANTYIFIPFAGYCYSGSFYRAGSDGYLWSSTLRDDNDAYRLYCSSDGITDTYNSSRYLGFSVRGVSE